MLRSVQMMQETRCLREEIWAAQDREAVLREQLVAQAAPSTSRWSGSLNALRLSSSRHFAACMLLEHYSSAQLKSYLWK